MSNKSIFSFFSLLNLVALSVVTVPLFAQTTGYNPLLIPPTLEGEELHLTMRDTTHVFFDSVATNTAAFNGTWLGPTLILNKGDQVRIYVNNDLDEPTTVHWHGMHVAAENDGGPHSVIDAGTTWVPEFLVRNKAATLWYHPHLHMFTNEHVNRGLAGMIIVRDNIEAALDLPRTYGVDDIPLVLQDREFDEQGQILFRANGKGALGGTFVINGTINPIVEAPAQVNRFRIVNGSAARVYNVGISDDQTMYQIGSDGGLFEAPIPLTRIRLSPGERAEILVDLNEAESDTVRFVNFASELVNGERGGSSDSSTPLDGVDSTFLSVEVVDATINPVTTVPTSLVTITPIAESAAVKTRPMAFNNDETNRPFGINGVGMDLAVVNEVVYKGDIEIWELTNDTPDPHPFHIHMVDFLVLDRDGSPPPENERGWKDVVLVYPNETVRFITKFETFSDPMGEYMYHCHILDHEDRGMMGQFVVVDNPTGIDEEGIDDNIFSARNYPNPFSEKTTLSYNLPVRSEMQIEVFDLLGKRIKVIFDGVREAGTYETIWKAADTASGTYLVRFSTPTTTVSRRVILRRN